MNLEMLKTINCLTHFRGNEKEEHMGYTKKEKEEINTWLVHVGALSDVDEPFEEFKKGQLLEIARAEKDSIMTWDEWQHLQNMLGMEVPLEMACAISGMLFENGIELMDMETENTKEEK